MYKSLQAIKLDVQRPILFFIGFILARGGQASKTSYTEWAQEPLFCKVQVLSELEHQCSNIDWATIM